VPGLQAKKSARCRKHMSYLESCEGVGQIGEGSILKCNEMSYADCKCGKRLQDRDVKGRAAYHAHTIADAQLESLNVAHDAHTCSCVQDRQAFGVTR
jgi:hypothetical protein